MDRQRAQLALLTLPASVETILDAGCGNGVFTNLENTNKRIFGLDRSRSALLHVKTARVQATLSAIPFPDHRFDAVVCMETLEHIPLPDYQQVLAEISRAARDYLLITVPYRENLRHSSVICPQCRLEFHPYYHMRSYDRQQISNLFSAAGGFSLNSAQAICPVEFRRFAGLWNLIRRYYHHQGANFPWYTTCPRCGYYKPQAATSAQKSATNKNPFKEHLQAAWPRTTSYLWWLALYQRI